MNESADEQAVDADIDVATLGDSRREEVRLSPGQQRVLSLVLAGESVFFTGVAGTGKSFLLHRIIDELDSVDSSNGLHVTASTGIAAVNVGGTTIHSFAGCGLCDQPLAKLIRKVLFAEDKRKRWKECKTLIIDEVSMISADLFDKLDGLARAVRRINEPFGGIQLVLTGDFLQLPPVRPAGDAVFCFESDGWSRCVPNAVLLERVFRQRDSAFVRLLHEIRLGECSETTELALLECVGRKLECADGMVATKILTHKWQVARENEVQLNALEGRVQNFKARDKGRKDMLKNMQAIERLELKVGAQVMLLKNLDVQGGLCNGTCGVVTSFRRQKIAGKLPVNLQYPVVRFENGIETVVVPQSFDIRQQGRKVASRTQVPLMLAWAITVHKSQGKTLRNVEISLDQAFEHGQVYVALSRATSLAGLRLLNFDPMLVKAHPLALAFYKSLEEVEEDDGGDRLREDD